MFKKDKDREKGAQLIRDEVKKISTMFLRLSHATSPKVHSVYMQLRSGLSNYDARVASSYSSVSHVIHISFNLCSIFKF